MPVQGLQGSLEFHGQAQGIEVPGLVPSLLRHGDAYVFPEIAKPGHFSTGNIIGNWYSGKFDDAAFDGIHQREVVHRPGKRR